MRCPKERERRHRKNEMSSTFNYRLESCGLLCYAMICYAELMFLAEVIVFSLCKTLALCYAMLCYVTHVFLPKNCNVSI